ncbi:MAG: hypothetical protein ACP5P1_11100 [Acidimicrobiales bacterium]
MTSRRLERLSPHHHLGDFHSANKSLDRWLQTHALASQQIDAARDFVLVDAQRVEGYFSLTMGSVQRAEALRKAVTASEAAAARLVVVDAIDEAAARFYARHGFITVPDHPPRPDRRMKDIRA